MVITSSLVEAHIIKIVNNKIEYLLIKRSENEIFPNIWQMVTGTIDQNELAYKTAIREIKEETGLVAAKFWVVPKINSFYSYQTETICLIPVFVALVNPNSAVKLSAEHSEFCWLSKKEAKKRLAWPDQRKSVDIIDNYFTNNKSLLKFIEINI
ncbi:MAG: NUDIX domain-containing protein [bacterium]